MGELDSSLDQGRIDALIWKHIGLKSVREIAELAGIKPEEVLRRKNELLEAVDVLTVQQKRQRLLIDLQTISRKVQEDYDASPFEFKSGLMNSAVAAMKVILTELNRAEGKDADAIQRLNSLREQELLKLVDLVVVTSVREIAQVHDLDEVGLMEIFQDRLVEAAQSLE